MPGAWHTVKMERRLAHGITCISLPCASCRAHGKERRHRPVKVTVTLYCRALSLTHGIAVAVCARKCTRQRVVCRRQFYRLSYTVCSTRQCLRRVFYGLHRVLLAHGICVLSRSERDRQVLHWASSRSQDVLPPAAKLTASPKTLLVRASVRLA